MEPKRNYQSRKSNNYAPKTSELGKLQPQDKELEEAVLGALMLEKDAYCADILVQVSAINSALNSFNKVLLSNHIHTCVAEDIRNGKDEAIDELVDLLKKLMK